MGLLGGRQSRRLKRGQTPQHMVSKDNSSWAFDVWQMTEVYLNALSRGVRYGQTGVTLASPHLEDSVTFDVCDHGNGVKVASPIKDRIMEIAAAYYPDYDVRSHIEQVMYSDGPVDYYVVEILL